MTPLLGLVREPPVSAARAAHHEQRLVLAAYPAAVGLAALARARGPVTSFPILGHVVIDPDLAREVFRDTSRFSKTGPGSISASLTEVFGPHALLNMDGEPHRLLRGRLGALFTPRFVHALAADVVTRPISQARAKLERGESVDLVRLARVIVGRMVAALLAVELDAGREDETCLGLYDLGVELGSVISVTRRGLDARRVAYARDRLDALTAHTRAAYDRGDERNVPGRLRSLGLSFEETRGVVGVLFLAGMETTASAIPRISSLFIDSGVTERLRLDRTLLPRAIDEGLRLVTPVPLATRNVIAPTQLGGTHLRANDRLIVFLHEALRTPLFGRSPRAFDLDRELPRDTTNLWFGHGPHFCLGFSLARREIELTLEMLLEVGELEITRRVYGRRVLFPTYSKLDVRVASPDARKSKSARVGA